MVTRLPNREGLQQLARDIEQALRDPPEPTVIAGSSLDALLYGPGVFDEISAQSAPGAIPPDRLRQLKHSDWQQRLNALGSLADAAAAEALPHLLGATADDDIRVQLAAMRRWPSYPMSAPARRSSRRYRTRISRSSRR